MRGALEKKRFIIKPKGHIIFTLAISGLVYIFFKSAVSFFASFFSGILIDIDHILDYYLHNGPTLKIKSIYFWHVHDQYSFLFIYLHSLELIILFWVVISVFRLGVFWVALAIGITQHMVVDLIFNKNVIYSYSYFLLYRFIKKFRKENILRDY